jgi:outer membrane biosynthesis protein TonB
VARNECRRWLRGRIQPAPADEADDRMDDTAVFGTVMVEQAELREVVRAALAGLNSGQRDVIELTLGHEFYGADLADALGVPLNQAHALASRARAQFETTLGALLVARSGQQSCPGLGDVLDGWDGQLTVLRRKQVKRHIERCDVCGERRRRELNPVALLGMLPAPVLPAAQREQVLRLVADDRPDAAGYRAEVEQEAQPFARSGFPVPLDPPAPVRGPGTFAPAAAAAVAAIAVLGGGVMFTADVVHHHVGPRVERAAAGPPALPSATPAPAAATPSPTKTARPRSSPASQVGYEPTYGAVLPVSTSRSTKPTTKPPTKPTTKPTPKPTKSASPTASASASASPTPTPTPTSTSTSTAGTSSDSSSLNLGLDPASIPLLSGASAVTSAIVTSPAGLPGTIYLVLD